MSDVINRRRPIVGPRDRFDFTVASPIKAAAERLAAERGITLTALIEEALLDKLLGGAVTVLDEAGKPR